MEKQKPRRLRIIGALIAIAAPFAVAIALLARAAERTGDEFLAALEAGEYDHAGALLAPDVGLVDFGSLAESIDDAGNTSWRRTGILGVSLAELVLSPMDSGETPGGWQFLLTRSGLDWRVAEVQPIDLATAERLVPNPRRLLALFRERLTLLVDALEAGDAGGFEALWAPGIVAELGGPSLISRYPNLPNMDPPMSRILKEQPLNLSKPQVAPNGTLVVGGAIGAPATHSAVLSFHWHGIRWQIVGFRVSELDPRDLSAT
jgi:hypothetical protein